MKIALSPYIVMSLLCCACCGEVVAQKQFSTIVLDPGHGGKDPGALGKKNKEKDIVLSVSQKLGKMLNDSLPAVQTLYTRSTDVFIPLDKRAEIANKNAADLFVSIHANANKSKDIVGAETFVLGLHRSKENLEVAQKENAVISMEEDYTNKYEGFDPSQPESYIIFELMQNVYLSQSIAVASFMQGAMAGQAGREDRGVKQAGFLVLRQTSMPSVLVELGFISNPEEEKYLASEEGQAQLVGALYQSIKAYKVMYDGLNNVSVNRQNEKKVEEKPKVDLWPAGLNFRVQVAASKNELKIDSLGHPVSYVLDGEVKKYMVGICSSPEEVEDLQKKLKERYPDCFLVAFDGKEKLSVRSAKKRYKNESRK